MGNYRLHLLSEKKSVFKLSKAHPEEYKIIHSGKIIPKILHNFLEITQPFNILSKNIYILVTEKI